MNPDLQNYINQARALGKADEVIKSELLNTGWAEADIVQVLGGSQVVVGGTAVAVSSGFGAYLYVVIVIVLVVFIAGGFWFYFSSNTFTVDSPIEDASTGLSSGVSDKSNTIGAMALNCRDLLSDSDIAQLTSINGNKFDITEELRPQSIECTYIESQSDAEMLDSLGHNEFPMAAIFWFKVSIAEHSIPEMKKTAEGLSLYMVSTEVQDIPNLGSYAYYWGQKSGDAIVIAEVKVLSSSQKYEITGGFGLGIGSLQESIDLLRAVDKNL